MWSRWRWCVAAVRARSCSPSRNVAVLRSCPLSVYSLEATAGSGRAAGLLGRHSEAERWSQAFFGMRSGIGHFAQNLELFLASALGKDLGAQDVDVVASCRRGKAKIPVRAPGVGARYLKWPFFGLKVSRIGSFLGQWVHVWHIHGEEAAVRVGGPAVGAGDPRPSGCSTLKAQLLAQLLAQLSPLIYPD